MVTMARVAGSTAKTPPGAVWLPLEPTKTRGWGGETAWPMGRGTGTWPM